MSTETVSIEPTIHARLGYIAATFFDTGFEDPEILVHIGHRAGSCYLALSAEQVASLIKALQKGLELINEAPPRKTFS